MTTTESTDWCSNLWNMLHDGGTWMVPRSGLVYRKDEALGALVLTARMPWDPTMHDHITEDQLREQQDSDHEGNRQMFTLIGVDVTCSIGS